MPAQIEEPSSPAAGGFALFALGFRPFFLLAGLSALVLIPLWVAAWSGALAPPDHFGGPSLWHGHEMLHGYLTAVLAGFLLTAVRNWTGIQTLNGAPLAGLAMLWLAARLAPWLPLPTGLVALIDLLPTPLLALAILLPIHRKRQKNNYLFPLLLLLLAVGNLMIHLEALDITQTARAGTTLSIYTILAIIIAMGGRVIPFFIERGAPGGATTRSWPWIERLALPSVALLGAVEVADPAGPATTLFGLLTAAIHAIRLAGWWTPKLLRVSLLWVLFTGYAWIVAGLLLTALATPLGLPWLIALHGLMAGGMAVITLGMMARVAIGHTGRQMRVGPVVTIAFALVNLAALSRVIAPLLAADRYTTWIHLAAGLWTLAFLLFVVVYAPILIRPRVDGRPG